jgi:hypothetical protein
MLRDALNEAESGQMPAFTTESLLRILKLDSDRRDGLVMIDRLIGERGRPPISALKAVVNIMRSTQLLIAETNGYRANPAQEAIAHSLGAVVTKQVTREGNLCPVALRIAMESQRDDIIPDYVRRGLAVQQAIQTGLLDFPAGQVQAEGAGGFIIEIDSSR